MHIAVWQDPAKPRFNYFCWIHRFDVCWRANLEHRDFKNARLQIHNTPASTNRYLWQCLPFKNFHENL